jgi:hypothetical protein
MKIDWKLPDWKGLSIAAVSSLAVLTLPGCLERIVKVPTPAAAQSRGFAPEYSVADIDFYQEQYNEDVTAQIEGLEKARGLTNTEWGYLENKGRATVEKWSGIATYASDPTTIAGFAVDPVGAGLSLLSFITGLGFRRRQDVTADTLRKEKEESYNAGLAKGAAIKTGGESA